MCKALDTVKIVDVHNHERRVPIVSCPICGNPVILEDADNWCENCDTTIDETGKVRPQSDLEIGAELVGR